MPAVVFRIVLASVTGVALASAPADHVQAQTPSRSAPIEGDWRVADGSAVVRLARCGDALCGRIVQLGADPAARDEANPDRTLATRRVCGITILQGLRLSAPGRWQDGRLYDPESGKTYDKVSVASTGDRLRLAVGAGPFAGSETWRRVPTLQRPCNGV